MGFRGIGRRKTSPQAEGFMLHGFELDNEEFMHRAMLLNRHNTPPRYMEASPDAEFARVKAQQREARRHYAKGIGLIATFCRVSVPPTVGPSDVGYGYAGIVQTDRNGTTERRVEIGNIFGSTTSRFGRQSMPLIAERLLLELTQGEEGDIEVVDPRRALRLASALDLGTQEWSKTDGPGIGSYITIQPELSEFWQEQMEARDAWSMSAQDVLAALTKTFPHSPSYEYQDHRR